MLSQSNPCDITYRCESLRRKKKSNRHKVYVIELPAVAITMFDCFMIRTVWAPYKTLGGASCFFLPRQSAGSVSSTCNSFANLFPARAPLPRAWKAQQSEKLLNGAHKGLRIPAHCFWKLAAGLLGVVALPLDLPWDQLSIKSGRDLQFRYS